MQGRMDKINGLTTNRKVEATKTLLEPHYSIFYKEKDLQLFS